MTPLDLLWLILVLSSLQPVLQHRYLASQRTYALRALPKQRGSRVVTLIHRRDYLPGHYNAPERGRRRVLGGKS